MADSPASWVTIESDPGVFTELSERLGVHQIEFEEMLSLDEDSFKQLTEKPERSVEYSFYTSQESKSRHVYGLVFLFKWNKQIECGDNRTTCGQNDYPDIFYAKQVIPNSCATHSILSILLNTPSLLVSSPGLHEFYKFTNSLDPHTRGLALANSDLIQSAHHSFYNCNSILQSDPSDPADKDDKNADDECFHFVSYIFKNGKIFELDATKNGPIIVGEGTEDNWLSTAGKEIQRRVDLLQASSDASIKFNLLAVVGNALKRTNQNIEIHRHIRQRAMIKLLSFGESITLEDEVDDDTAPEGIPSIDNLPDDVTVLKNAVTYATGEISHLKAIQSFEQAKREKWAKENSRRRHDWVPFLLCALRHLGRRGEIKGAYDDALIKVQEQKKKAEENKTKTEL